MLRRLVLSAIALSLALAGAACGGGDDEDAAPTTAAAGATTDDGGSTDDDGGDDGSSDGGEVDCEAVLDAAGRMGMALQVLAQLRTQAQYDLVKEGTIALDPDEVLAAVEGMRPLEDVDIPEGVTATSVEEALDLYEEAASLAKENLAVDDPFADAQGDELAALTEDVSGFLGGQAAISFALDSAGC